MKTVDDDCKLFREECLFWQQAFGLNDWEIVFKFEEAKQGQDYESETDLDCDTRYATVTYFHGIVDAIHPADVALHEMQHLLYADMLLSAIHARDESDPILGREEHKVIIRMGKVLSRVKRDKKKETSNG